MGIKPEQQNNPSTGMFKKFLIKGSHKKSGLSHFGEL
jgi:hypothetical protein